MRVLKPRHNIGGDWFEISTHDQVYSLSRHQTGVVINHYLFCHEYDVQWQDGSVSERVSLMDLVLPEDAPELKRSKLRLVKG
jgi:hypothetical protein